MLLVHFARALQVRLEVVIRVGHVHRGAAQHVRRADQTRVADFLAEFDRRLQVGQFLPPVIHVTVGTTIGSFNPIPRLPGLRDPDAVQHTGEFEPILGSVDRFGRGAENSCLLPMEIHGDVIRQLATHG